MKRASQAISLHLDMILYLENLRLSREVKWPNRNSSGLVCSSQGDQCRRQVISAFLTEIPSSSHWNWLDSRYSPLSTSRSRVGCHLTWKHKGVRELPPLAKGSHEGLCHDRRCYPAQLLHFSHGLHSLQTKRFL